ncbi:hypothetical protein F66182_6821 [Fusarium sp. NRRL 66182]|nr:hypothetical protein F66182_6821 [Fusarium sp. NRRL 66182]
MIGYTTSSRFIDENTFAKSVLGDSIVPSRLDIILDLCSRQADDLNSEKEPCLVCGEELSLSTLQRHLAAHMEDTALFVLPNAPVDEQNGSSMASARAAKRGSKGQTANSSLEVSSLDFSAAADLGQTPADFSKLFAGEEDDGYTTKFSNWIKANQDEHEHEHDHEKEDEKNGEADTNSSDDGAFYEGSDEDEE